MEISGFHIHVYSGGWATHQELFNLREKMYDDLFVPHILDTIRPIQGPIGPHTVPMVAGSFKEEWLGTVLIWAIKNHKECPVLVHPITHNELDDHTKNAIWIGEKQFLDLTKL